MAQCEFCKKSVGYSVSTKNCIWVCDECNDVHEYINDKTDMVVQEGLWRQYFEKERKN